MPGLIIFHHPLRLLSGLSAGAVQVVEAVLVITTIILPVSLGFKASHLPVLPDLLTGVVVRVIIATAAEPAVLPEAAAAVAEVPR